jgi:Meiotically up-regulated gene 113
MSTLYIIRNLNSRRIKIGKSNNPLKRLQALQTGNDDQLELIATLEIEDAAVLAAERTLHIMFQAFRKDGEWFELDKKHEDLLLGIFLKRDVTEKEAAAFKRLGFR